MEAKRQRILDLLHAGVPVSKVTTIVECSVATVYRTYNTFKARGDIKRKEGSGGHNKKKTETFMMGVACEIEASPTTSKRAMAKDLGVSEKTIRTVVKELGAFSYVRRRRQLLTEQTKKSRVAKGKLLLWWLRKNPSTVKIFSDKKMFVVDQARNARNDRYLAYCVDEVPPINQTKHPQGVMMLGVVASDGKRMPPHFFPAGLKINTEVYLDVLTNVVKPWLDENYPQGNYVWQQDSAPAHKSKICQAFCKDNFAKFWPSTMWPPSSPDANPLDFAVWGFIESKACATPHRNTSDLKASITKEWEDMPVAFLTKTCRSFRPRLEAMVKAEGGHFEKM